MSSTYTGTSQWFQVPPYGTATDTTFYVNEDTSCTNYGPFAYNNRYYWFIQQRNNTAGQNHRYVAYYATPGQSQPFTLVPSTFSCGAPTQLSNYWDGTGSNVCCMFITGGTAPFSALVAKFDMTAGTWGTSVDPGITYKSSDVNNFFYQNLSGGNEIIVWNEVSVSTGQTYSKLFSSGTWGGTNTLGTNTRFLCNVIPITSTSVGMFHTAPLVGVGTATTATIYYDTCNGTAIVASTSTGITKAVYSFYPYPILHDTVHDQVICSIPEVAHPSGGSIYNNTIFSVTPSTGGAITRTVVDTDPSADFEREMQYIGADATFGTFYMMTDQSTNTGSSGTSTDAQIFIYSAPAVTGPWSGQSQYYSLASNNASPAAFPDSTLPALVFPYSFKVMSGGDINLTLGLEYGTGGPDYSMLSNGPPAATIIAPCPTTNTLFIGTAYTSTLTAVGGNGTYAFEVLP